MGCGWTFEQMWYMCLVFSGERGGLNAVRTSSRILVFVVIGIEQKPSCMGSESDDSFVLSLLWMRWRRNGVASENDSRCFGGAIDMEGVIERVEGLQFERRTKDAP